MKGKNKEQTQAQPVPQQLSLPDMAPLDHTKHCPRYTSILARADGDGVGIEEMDSLQMEIESLLVNVMQRNRQLKMETMILDSWNNDKNETIILNTNPTPLSKTTSLNTAGTSSPIVDKQLSNLKKIKSFSGKPTSLNTSNYYFSKNNLINDKLPIVRNDIPDTFWQSVEPYCSDITEDDVKLLENQIEMNDKYLSFSKLGPLGKHYSLQWAEEDLNQQIKEGSRFADLDKNQPSNKRKLSSSAHLSKEKRAHCVNSLMDESMDKLNKDDEDQQQQIANDSISYGPLTQRLISALIEQNLMTPYDNEIADYFDKIGPPKTSYMSPRTMAKNFNLNANHNSLEKKIKKTLIEQGILEVNEGDKSNDISSEEDTVISKASGEPDKDDELAIEIKNIQNELKVITKQCKNTLVQLLNVSKQNLTKQDLKKKINVIDVEIIDLFEKFKTQRLAKKSLTKKDKDKAHKLMNDRKELKIQLSNLERTQV